jgi:PTS system, lactose/cellobiose family IIC component
MNRFLMPIAHAIDKQPHMNAVKKGMVVLTPFLLIGSFFVATFAIPDTLPKGHPIGVWFDAHAAIFNLPVKLSLGLIGLYAVMAIAYFLSEHYKLYTVGSMALATSAFLIQCASFKDGMMVTKFLDAKGLFTGIFVAIIAVEIYRFCTVKKFIIKMPEGVPDFVSKSFELIPPTALIIGLSITVRAICEGVFNKLLPEIIMSVLAPAISSLDSIWVIIAVIMLKLTFWFFGIHSAVLSPVIQPIAVQYLAENIQNMQAGQPLTHVVTNGTMSAFAGFSGAGITIGLVLAMLLSKSSRYRKVGQVALIPSLFGINEPVLFGVPVILNPVLVIPFIVGGALVSAFPLLMMKLGLLNYPIFDPPYVPIFMEGFLTNFDYRSILVQVVQVIMSFVLYFPFFKILEKQELDLERTQAKETKFSKEDQKVLDNMDLDF